MRNKYNSYIHFNYERKLLYIVFSIVLLSVLALTVVYAALSTTLQINGNAEVTAASWDIYLDNVKLNSNSVTSNVPTITNKTMASFSTVLSNPGDFYEFTIDVVNNGSIDAMIDSVEKTPELSDSQKKYLNYIVEYQNGESIMTKQLVSKKSFVRLKVKVEFRKDINSTDIPQTTENLNFSFNVNYLQSDESAFPVKNDGIQLIKTISGNLDTIGSEVCIDTECFYVISSDTTSVTLFSKYNLHVGYECSSFYPSSCVAYGSRATGKQDLNMLGLQENYPINGITNFSTASTVYEGSIVEGYINDYGNYLDSLGVVITEARPIKIEELVNLGCSLEESTCLASQYSWIYSSSYWCESDDTYVYRVLHNGIFNSSLINLYAHGVRPVVRVLKG